MQRREKFQSLAILAACDQRHLASFESVIGKGYGPGGRLARNLEASEAGAQFQGQREGAAGLCRAFVESERQGGQHPRHARRVQPVCLRGHFAHPICPGA